MEHKSKVKYRPIFNEIFQNGIATKVIDVSNSLVTVTLTSEISMNCFVDTKVFKIKDFEELISYCAECIKTAQWEHTKYMLLRVQSLCRYAIKEEARMKRFEATDGGSLFMLYFETDKEANHFVDHLAQAVRT